MVKKSNNKQSLSSKKTITNYNAGDFLIRLKNISMARRPGLSISNTKYVSAIAGAMKEEGFLREVEVSKEGVLNVSLTYSHKEPVLTDVKLISKPGLRVYSTKDELMARKETASILMLSTSKGVMSHKKAIKNELGGEVIAEIW